MTVARSTTQETLDRLAGATLRHTPAQAYTVGDRFAEAAVTHAGRTFILFEDQRITYADFNAAANRVAHAARQAGLRRGHAAALLMHNRPEFIAAWAGLAKLGVTAALVNTQLRGQALRHAIATAGARTLIAGSECLDNVESAGERLVDTLLVRGEPTGDTTEFDATLARMPADDPDPAWRDGLVAGDDLFYVSTSGTTGLPKAARLSHMRYLGVGDGMSAVAGYEADDAIACTLPLYHGAGGMVVVSCALARGGAIALFRRFSASRFWDDVRRHRVTGWQYIGEMCRYLVNQPPTPRDRDHCLRVMMGAGLGPTTWAAFQERFAVPRILEGWSSTEANTSLINVDGRVGSCGRIPFRERHNGRLIRWDPDTETHPRDEKGFCIECAPGEVGEFIGMIPNLPNSGAGRFEGYTSAADTERKILRGVFQAGDAWYRSGDLLHHDADDYFYFVDRIGDTFRWKSENVSTQEVADALAGFPGVESANVYGVVVPGTEGRAGMAALVLTAPDAFDGRAFWAWTAERLPAYAAPVYVRLVRQADVTTTFKLRKIDLQRDGYDPARVSDPLWVRDDAARTYVRLKTKE